MDILLKRAFMLITLTLISGCDIGSKNSSPNPVVHPLNLTEYSTEKSNEPLNLLFIHHSSGATLFADSGEKSGEYCLFESHPNGGGLRNLLRQNNYNVHEATYGSKLGEHTDINHWHSKFRDHIDLALKTKIQDDLLDDEVNQIIMFKSCYPNNHFISYGTPTGDPDLAEKTVWNAKAAYNSLLPIFKKYPNTLFVVVTAPPIVKPWMNKYKEILLRLIGKGPEKIGERARLFNNWLVDTKDGWLSDYTLQNIVVFDYYDILTDNGKSYWTQYPTKDGKNSHPSSAGNSLAAEKFVIFINQATKYAGLTENE